MHYAIEFLEPYEDDFGKVSYPMAFVRERRTIDGAVSMALSFIRRRAAEYGNGLVVWIHECPESRREYFEGPRANGMLWMNEFGHIEGRLKTSGLGEDKAYVRFDGEE